MPVSEMFVVYVNIVLGFYLLLMLLKVHILQLSLYCYRALFSLFTHSPWNSKFIGSFFHLLPSVIPKTLCSWSSSL